MLNRILCGVVCCLLLCGWGAPVVYGAVLTDNGNGTVTDSSTGLVWQQGEGGTQTWENALAYCENLSLGGADDWRLPNIKELESLTDDNRYVPALDSTYFPNAVSFFYWSSTTYASNTNSAWYVDFDDGVVGSSNKGTTYYVRCVRGGQSGALGALAIDVSFLNNKKVGGTLYLDAKFDDITAFTSFYLEKNGVKVAKITMPATYSPQDMTDTFGNLGRYTWYTLAGEPISNWSEILTETSPVPFRLLAQKVDSSWHASQVFSISYQSQVVASVSSDKTMPQTSPAAITLAANATGCTTSCSYRWLLPGAGSDNLFGTSSTLSADWSGGGAFPLYLEVSDAAGNITYAPVMIALTRAYDAGDPAESGSGSKLVNGVDVSTGNLHLSANDISVPGKGVPFSLTRSYNSSARTGRWTDAFSQQVEFIWQAGNKLLNVLRDDGRRQMFFRDLDNQWYGINPGSFDQLKENSDGSFTLYTKGSVLLSFDVPAATGVASLKAITDRDGNSLTVTAVSATQKRVTDASGRQYTLDYDANGRLTKVTDFSGRYVQYSYDANGFLTSVRDLRGYTTNYTYNASGQLLTIKDPRGTAASPQYNTLAVTYDANGRVQYLDDANGYRTAYQYGTIDGVPGTAVVRPTTNGGTVNNNLAFKFDAIGRIPEEINALNYGDYRAKRQFSSAVVAKRAADQGLVSSATTPRNFTTTFAYSDDGRGNKASSTNPLSQTTGFGTKTEADYPGALPNLNVMSRLTTPLANSYNFSHTTSGNMQSITSPVSATTNFAYGAGGLLQSVTDPASRSTSFEYDANGNTTKVTDAKSQAASYSYDSLGRVDTATDRRGVVTKYTYDAAGNVLTTTSAYGTARAATITNTYDANGNLATARDARGNTRSYSYTKDNRLATESFTVGGVTYTSTNTYDELGRLWKVTNENSHTERSDFDEAGRKKTETDALSSTTTYTYDANGNVLTTIDPLGHVTTYTYDALDRVATVKDHLNNTVAYSYTAEGNLQSVTDPKGQVTSYEYDAAGRLIRVTDANGQQTSATYDAAGNLKTVSGPKPGNLVTYGYDELHRLTSLTDANNNVWSFSYDANGNLLTQTVPGQGTTQYQYDELNRVTRVTYPDASTVQYSYDLNGNRTSMVDSIGTTSYSYDEANRLSSVTDPFGKVVAYSYDGVGNVKRIVYPGTKNLDYSYDAGERLATVTNWLGRTTSYTYNKIHQLTQITNANGTRTTLGYDNANRLTSLQNLKGSGAVISSHGYTLDSNGNIQQAAVTLPLQPRFASATSAMTFDAANRIITGGGFNFSHDLAGRIVAATMGDLTMQYQYNFRDQLTAILGGDSYSFAYNGDGNRLAMTKNGVQTRYVLNLNQELPDVLAETDASGTVTNYYTYGNGLISKINAASGQEQWYHFDPTGNTLALTDSSQNVTDAYAYTPYGEVTSQGNSWNPFKYSGKHGVMDDGNGTNYMRARYYMPFAGRFMSLDAVWGDMNQPQGLNRYAYVQGDPMRKIDPSGLYSMAEFGRDFKEHFIDSNLFKDVFIPAITNFVGNLKENGSYYAENSKKYMNNYYSGKYGDPESVVAKSKYIGYVFGENLHYVATGITDIAVSGLAKESFLVWADMTFNDYNSKAIVRRLISGGFDAFSVYRLGRNAGKLLIKPEKMKKNAEKIIKKLKSKKQTKQIKGLINSWEKTIKQAEEIGELHSERAVEVLEGWLDLFIKARKLYNEEIPYDWMN